MPKTVSTFTLFLILLAITGQAQKRIQIDLNTDWTVTSLEPDESMPDFNVDNSNGTYYKGNMPKQVQEFIYEKGELPDPAVENNAQKWVPVFQKDWVYVKQFKTPDWNGQVNLCFDGLDTEVDVFLNNKKIANCNNMHRRWSIPITSKLFPENQMNTLMLRFYPPQKAIERFTAKYPDYPIKSNKYKFIRKTGSDFSSYLGAKPNFLKTGIYDDVYLDILPDVYLGDVHVKSELKEDYSLAQISVDTDIENYKGQLIRYQVFDPSGIQISKGTSNNKAFSVDINKPELWFPMNYGSQPMYKMLVELLDDNTLLDKKEIDFGIREIEIVQKDKKTGEARFAVSVNGEIIFMNGACWAPLHGFTHVWNEERADKLLGMMKLGNMNFLRIWGEGSIPGKSLFDFCDQNGIVIMMDFMTSHPIEHPIFDDEFSQNMSLEIVDVIKRLRNHSCIAFWSGGNEHYLAHQSNLGDNTKPLGRELFQKIMPDLVKKYDTQRYFHPSSPWGGDNWINGNYPLEGDYHDYSTIRFQPLSSVPLFTTEVCMVSPYSLHNMKKHMSEEDVWPENFRFSVDKPGKKAWPAGWEKHSIGSAWEKIGRIQDYCDIQTAEDGCRVLGLAHGQYLKERYERQRRGVPDGETDGNRRSWGAAVWRLNDTWPMIYMSVIDYYLEPKIPYYFLKRACEPVLISFEQSDDNVSVWVVNDTPHVLTDSLIVELKSFDGNTKKRIKRAIHLEASESKRVTDLTHEFYEILKRRDFLFAQMGKNSKTHLLWPEKYLRLKSGKISAQFKNEELILRSDYFIKDVALNISETSGAIFSDNYFNLVPGEAKKIKIINSAGGNQLQIKGLNSDVIYLDL